MPCPPFVNDESLRDRISIENSEKDLSARVLLDFKARFVKSKELIFLG